MDDSNIPYLHLVVVFVICEHAFSTWLDLRQLKAAKRPKPPAELQQVFRDELYRTTQAYSIDRWWLGFVRSQVDFVEKLLTLWLLLVPWLWSQTVGLLERFCWKEPGEIVTSVAFLLLTGFIGMVQDLPWGLYSTFVVEQRHGFNKQTLLLYFTDVAKNMVLGLVLVPPLGAGVTYILMVAGPWLPLMMWAFLFTLSLFFMTIYPTVIAPLFNTFSTLPQGELREAIEGLARSLSFPLTQLYVVDGSRRSAHSNAYMYGFFKNKRIVLFDTLLEQCSQQQVVAVLAHELGHWKLSHVMQLFGMMQVILLSQLSAFSLIRSSSNLYRAFGFHSVQPAIIAVQLFQSIIAPIDHVLTYINNLISRRFEFQADKFAVDLGQGQQLRTALLKLEEENKSCMHSDTLYSAYHHSHPPLVERLRAIDASQKKSS